MPEFTQFDSVKSMIRYFPANGTDGLARFSESTLSRVPSPPAIIIATTRMGASSWAGPASWAGVFLAGWLDCTANRGVAQRSVAPGWGSGYRLFTDQQGQGETWFSPAPATRSAGRFSFAPPRSARLADAGR